MPALIFDLDDTLVVEEASAEAAFIETGGPARDKYGIDPSDLHSTLRKACRELWYGFPSHPYCKRVGISSWEGMWAEFIGPDPDLKALREWAPVYRYEAWRKALHLHGIEDADLAAEMAEAFPRLRRKKHAVYPDTIRTLERLRGNYILALLTNGASDLQRRKIEGSGINGYFSQILISGDIGIGKPDPGIFRMLLARMRANAEATVTIGNSISSDIQGAHAAGLRAVWLNRSGASRDDSIVPDWEISTLDELFPILACVFPGIK
ncbi:MAG: HAD family hydrolase [Acidobacteria bacterium]|nr:HAD family hydrolase [Acidobacteriota bacterium]